MACHSPPLKEVKKQGKMPAITHPRSHPFKNGWYQACLRKATADKAL